jgi:hypothetical protein
MLEECCQRDTSRAHQPTFPRHDYCAHHTPVDALDLIARGGVGALVEASRSVDAAVLQGLGAVLRLELLDQVLDRSACAAPQASVYRQSLPRDDWR